MSLSSDQADDRANDYAFVVQTCLDNGNCPGVTVCESYFVSLLTKGGFGDIFSWIPGVFAGFGAADLYDFDFKPKPAFSSVQATL